MKSLNRDTIAKQVKISLCLNVCLETLREGTFVDIGASDGVNLSNTLHFEKRVEWIGNRTTP